MYRFVRIVTRVAPLAFAFYSAKPIFNHQQQTEKIANDIQKASELIKNIAVMKQNSREEQKKEQLSKAEQKKQTQEKEQNKEEEQEQSKPIKGKQKVTAKISKNTSKFLISYLKMQGVGIQFTNTSDKINLENQLGDKIQIEVNESWKIKEAVVKISNFLNPPEVIANQQSLKNILQSLPEDENVIGIFIPQQSQYNLFKTPKSQLDTFTRAQMHNIGQIQSDFRKRKYNSSSNKNRFIIVKDESLAKKIKMNPNKPGTQYVYYKTTFNQGMETSSLLFGHKFTIKTNPFNVDPEKDLFKRGLYGYINQINFEGDMVNFMRSLSMNKEKRKLLVVYSKERRPQFLRELKSIALKTAKMMKDQAIVLMTDNPKLLTDYLQVIPDEFVTVRLFDLNRFQPSLVVFSNSVDSQKKFYCRQVLEGPFTVQNICQLIKNKSSPKQHYEYRNPSSIKSIVSIKNEADDNTVIVYWKYGCQGCELTLKYLESINQIIANLDEQKQFQYEIEDPQLLKNIKFVKFNILNESEDRAERKNDFTPRMFLYSNGKQKDLEIEKILSKISQIKVQKEETVHNTIMKQIINKITEQVKANQNHADL